MLKYKLMVENSLLKSNVYLYEQNTKHWKQNLSLSLSLSLSLLILEEN